MTLSMNGALIGALAALGGSLVGSMAPVLANYVVQKSQTQRELLTHEISLRESLYAEFIKDAARLYAKSMSSDLDTADEMVALYALVSRLRLVASDPILKAAEALVISIGRQFGEPNLTLAEMNAAATTGLDPLGPFSTACRRELREITRRNSKLVTWRKIDY